MEFLEVNSTYKNAYRRAYEYLAAAGTIAEYKANTASEESIHNAAENCAALVPAPAISYCQIRHCFMDALCGNGRVSLLNELGGWRVYSIKASPSDGSAVLKVLGSLLIKNSHSLFFCHCPFFPDMLRHLLIPGCKIIFTCTRPEISVCAAALDCSKSNETAYKAYTDLLEISRKELSLAKSKHDALEAMYNPYVDFSAVQDEALKHINTLL